MNTLLVIGAFAFAFLAVMFMASAWINYHDVKRLEALNDDILQLNADLLETARDYESTFDLLESEDVIATHHIELDGNHSDGEIAMQVLDMLKEVRGNHETD